MSTSVFVLFCTVMAAMSIPLILRRVKPNSTYGFRTARTLSSPDIWYPANVFGGWALLVAAAVTAAIAFVLRELMASRTWLQLLVLVGPVLIAALASTLYVRRIDPRSEVRRNNADPAKTRGLLVGTATVFAIVSVPLMFRLVPPNSAYGFRTSVTLSSPAIWYPANVFAGWTLLISAITTGAAAILLPRRLLSRPWVGLAVILIPLALAVLACYLYLARLS